jgi:diguanylate cyclase (GGDEF)-like protein
MFAPSLRMKLTLALLFVGLASAVLVGVVARQILMPVIDPVSLARFQSAMFYGVGAAAALAIALGLAIGVRLSHRVTRLTTAVTAMAAGDLYQHVDEGSEDEVGVLARMFNQMSRELFESRLRIDTQTQMLRELSVRDELTGLHNRRHFDDQAATAFAHARRYRRRLTVMMCDVDHFKTINDRFSHAVGDEVLRQVARILQANTRASDIVARYGGEEFAVVVTESEPEAAHGLALRIRERIEQHAWAEIEPELQVTISIGLDSTVTRPGIAEMLAAADERLYLAKRGGRNRVIADS